jgi:hypothetical protein
VNGVYADRDNFEGRIFKSTGKQFLPFAEMRMQIREQGFDLKSAIDLVVKGTQKITRSCGVAVGLLRAQNAFLLWGVTS